MRLTTLVALLFTASSLGACGGGPDDVEVVLPFVGNIMGKTKNGEATMVERGSLVLPPAVKGLPVPTDKRQASNTDANWVADPDIKAKTDAEIAAFEEAKYQREGDWSGKRSSGNGNDDFNDKVDPIRRKKGVLQSRINKPEYRK